METINYKRNRHSCYRLEYHLVVVTKYRHPVIEGALKNRLLEITRNLLTESWKCEIISMNTDIDHIHIMFSAPPQIMLSSLVNNYKTVSARLIRKEFAETLKPYYWKPYFWSKSYFICSVSEKSKHIVRRYIENQGEANPS